MSNTATYPASSDAPQHLGTHIPSGGLDSEKGHGPVDEKNPEGIPLDEEDDEDIDQLIDDLESQDGHDEAVDDDEAVAGSSARPVPEDLLQTDTRTGLTSAEVEQRRKKYGLNQMKEEKENLILKFLFYFIGPIQFVMEVCFSPHPKSLIRYQLLTHVINYLGCCYSRCRSSGLG